LIKVFHKEDGIDQLYDKIHHQIGLLNIYLDLDFIFNYLIKILPTLRALCDEFCPFPIIRDFFVENPFRFGLYSRRIFGKVNNESNV